MLESKKLFEKVRLDVIKEIENFLNSLLISESPIYVVTLVKPGNELDNSEYLLLNLNKNHFELSEQIFSKIINVIVDPTYSENTIKIKYAILKRIEL